MKKHTLDENLQTDADENDAAENGGAMSESQTEGFSEPKPEKTNNKCYETNDQGGENSR